MTQMLSNNEIGSVKQAFKETLKRDLILAYRSKGDLLNPLMFFAMIVSLFPLAVSPESAFLSQIAPGVIWVGALLACLLSLDAIFRSDFDDGSLEQMLLTPQPLFVLVLAKILSHWLISGLPLAIVAPILALMLALPDAAYGTLFISLLIGTPILSLLGAIGAGLTVGLRKGGMLLPLLILPLYIPVLIFAASAVQSAGAGIAVVGQLAFLGAFLCFSLVVSPFATVMALKISTGR